MDCRIDTEQPRKSNHASKAVDGRSRVHALPFVVLVPLVIAALHAYQRPIWYDEFYSFYLARVPRLHDLWLALTSGTDLNPPLNYVAVRGLFRLFGSSPVALRAPSIAGFGVFCICLYYYAARRLRPVYACLAMVFPLVTEAFSYAYEGRPYGLLLGLSGLALLGWQAATEEHRRWFAPWVLGIALALALSTHFYAVLVFVPLGLGELARSWSRRRIDVPVCLALFAGLAPLLGLRDIMRASGQYSHVFWSKPSWGDSLLFYVYLLKTTMVPALAVLVFLAIDGRLTGIRTASVPDDDQLRSGSVVPAHELIAALGFVALPLVGIALSKLVAGGSFTYRYALPAVTGVALLAAYVGERVGSGRILPGAVMAVSLAGWFLLTEGYHLSRGPSENMFVSVSEFECAAGSELPVVITWPKLFLQARHELPAPLAQRLVFVLRGDTTDNRGLRLLSRWAPITLAEYDEFMSRHERFFVCGFPTDPVYSSLLDSGASVRMLCSRRFREGQSILALVELRAARHPKPQGNADRSKRNLSAR
jgi:hypothetical protein